jgi:hypothetical protein
MAVALKEKSNFSRYLRLHEVISKNPAIHEAFLKELDKKGNSTNWSLEKVYYEIVFSHILS